MDKRFSVPYSHPRWWWNGSYIPNCFHCAHFRGAIKGKICCIAYPDGIPKELLKEGFTHNQPYPGDQGILFETIENSSDS